MFYLNTIKQMFLLVEHLDQFGVCLPYSRLLAGIPILAVFQNFRWNSIKKKYFKKSYLNVEMFYLNSTLNFWIPPVLVFQLEVYYKVDRLLTGLPAQQKGTTAWCYSNKTSLYLLKLVHTSSIPSISTIQILLVQH